MILVCSVFNPTCPDETINTDSFRYWNSFFLVSTALISSMNCLNEKLRFGETGIIWKITYSDLFKKNSDSPNFPRVSIVYELAHIQKISSRYSRFGFVQQIMTWKLKLCKGWIDQKVKKIDQCIKRSLVRFYPKNLLTLLSIRIYLKFCIFVILSSKFDGSKTAGSAIVIEFFQISKCFFSVTTK